MRLHPSEPHITAARTSEAPLAHGWQVDPRVERLRRVLAEEGIKPVYQPIVELGSGRVIAYEALSRFPGDPSHTPARWFADAWEVGLGLELELMAARITARALPVLPPGIGLSINASPPTVAATGFLRYLAGRAERVTVELTEHLDVTDYGDLRGALAPIKTAGASTAIDDFGAGFASLQHILKVRPDWIKLDMSLTEGIDSNPVAHALTAALVTFARRIEVGVIAEGIETAAQQRVLERLGIRFGQGFHLGMPKPLHEALAESA
jgi:EAL domain-containing protein (putative c-di-GMP-specific phosphodiesterase class I)